MSEIASENAKVGFEGDSQGENMVIEQSEDSVIDDNKSDFMSVKEGKAEILFPKSRDVFYNPVQEFNRDLSIAVITQYVIENHQNLQQKSDNIDQGNEEDISNNVTSTDDNSNLGKRKRNQNDQGILILEALAASGLRSIRYALEVPNVRNIIANDIQSRAVKSITKNARFNNVAHLVTASESDASMLMYQHRKYCNRFDVVDLDPYGSPVQFLDGAVQCVKDGGLLLVTCTDVAILCGNAGETCYAKYGAYSLKSKSCHEMALRIVLQCIESHANRYGRYIVPLISISADFYVRVFVRIFTSQSKTKQTASKLALVHQCVGCETISFQPMGKCVPGKESKNYKYTPSIATIQPNCQHCGSKHQIGGPIWMAPIHDVEFVDKVVCYIQEFPEKFNTSKRMEGVLSVISEELPNSPLYYTLDRLSSTLHAVCPNMLQFRSAILNAGYKVSYSHAAKSSIKTDAPAEVLWDIMRNWVKINPLKRVLSDTSPAKHILSKEPSIEISFDVREDSNPQSRLKRLVRFQENPEKYWGPKCRSTTSVQSHSQEEKRVKNQGKKRSHRFDKSTDLKTFPCKKFKQGKCNLGDDCKYNHTLENEGTCQNEVDNLCERKNSDYVEEKGVQ